MITNQAPAAIEVTGLRKSYGDHVVLDGIDCQRRSKSEQESPAET